MKTPKDFAQMWAAQTDLFEKNIEVNTAALANVKMLKAEHTMRGYLSFNILSLVVSTLLLSLTAFFIYAHIDAMHMVLSGLVVLVWGLLIFVGALRHIKMQLSLDYSQPVIEVQNQLNEIALSALYFLRASLMILPFYFAYLLIFVQVFFGIDLYLYGDKTWLITQAIFSVLFAGLAVFLFIHLSPKNIDKPLTRWLMKGCGNQALLAAQSLNQLQDYTNDDKQNNGEN